MNGQDTDERPPWRRYRPDNTRCIPTGTVFWNRNRWWRKGANGLDQLIAPRGHDDITSGSYTSEERKVAAARWCGCYICRDLLQHWGADHVVTPGMYQLEITTRLRDFVPVATCEGPCGKTFPWFDLTMVHQREGVGHATRSLCRECFWSRPTTTGILDRLLSGPLVEARLWIPDEPLTTEPLGELDPAFVQLGYMDGDDQ